MSNLPSWESLLIRVWHLWLGALLVRSDRASGPYKNSPSVDLDSWNDTIMCEDKGKYLSPYCVSRGIWLIHLTHQAVTVTLRIEGLTKTIFEGPVSTKFHRITVGEGANSQKYHCNGLNNDKNPCPGPTCTTALDDAMTATGLKIPYIA
jgi:hypothetical protein